MGHILRARVVEPDPTKVEAMIQWPCPSNVCQLHGFLGLTGFYCRFVKNYASIAFPQTELLKKEGFYWDITTQKAFDDLKVAISTAPVLCLPDFNKPFSLLLILRVWAWVPYYSKMAIQIPFSARGFVLSSVVHPLMFASCTPSQLLFTNGPNICWAKSL